MHTPTPAAAGSDPDPAAGIPRPLVAPLIDELARAITQLCAVGGPPHPDAMGQVGDRQTGETSPHN